MFYYKSITYILIVRFRSIGPQTPWPVFVDHFKMLARYRAQLLYGQDVY